VAPTIELETWLAEHHAQHEAIWLVTYKKAVPANHTLRDEVLDLLVTPDDLRTTLETTPGAVATLEAFPPSTRRNIPALDRAG
jgi:uncharacterized protein YdeI (YjbR/CyaY-like superfamily)